MTPRDFFISSRQLFGYVVPGVVWLCVGAMVFLEASVRQLISMASDSTVVGAAWFIGLAAMAGTFARAGSYTVLRALTRSEFVARTNEHHAYLRTEAVRRLKEAGLLPPTHPAPLLGYDQARELFTVCKELVVKHSPELVPTLVEKEAEINLVAMLSTPFLGFSIAAAWRAFELHEAGFRWATTDVQIWIIWRLGLVLAGVLFVVYSRRRFLKARIDEEKTCLRLFLATVDPARIPISEGHRNVPTAAGPPAPS
jgi:hypothetical protein